MHANSSIRTSVIDSRAYDQADMTSWLVTENEG